MTKFRYKHIQSTVEDKVPLDLLDGEIAVNRFAGKEKLFLKNASNEIASFSSDSQIDGKLANKLNVSDFNTYSGAVNTTINSKASQTDLNILSGTVTGHTADTNIHVTTADKTAWNNKVDTSDIADFFDDAKYENSGSTKVINFYHGSTVKATIDATDFIKDGMIDSVELETKSGTTYLVITWNTDAGKQKTELNIGDIFEADNYYTKNDLTATTGYATVTKANSANTASTVSLTGVTGADDLKAIEALTGTSGILKKTAANAWSLDTTSYSSATQVNTALAGKSDTGHTHDDRYYTETEINNKIAAMSGSSTGSASKTITAMSETNGVVTPTYANISITKSQVSDFAHNQASNTITAMTDYAKATTASAIASGDTLNQAIGKLEKALDGKQPSGSYVTTGRKVSTASGLTGGGDLSADRTIGLATVGTAGTYYRVVVDEYGRVTSGNTTDANTNYYTTGLTVSTAETSNTITVKGNNSAVSGTAVLNSATTSAAGLMSKADKSKLDGIATGAEVNQNAFSKIKINAESTTIDADSKTDTLTVSAGTFVTLTSDATNDKFTIGVSTGTSSSDLARGDHDHDGAYQAKGSYLTGTTKYAGSSTQGGAATSANKLNTDAGSATNPIYFSGGVPTALSYTIEKSVPSNAVFTDTKVTAVGNHYIPSATSADTKSATASSTAELAWGSAVVTGVTLSGDAKGHITSVTLASGKLKTPVTGVTLASGTNNGTVKLTVNGTATDNIAVKGLSGMAYQATSSYSSATQVNTALSGKQDTLTFDGTYNASTNKAATVSTVTNAIGALDASLTGSAGAGKTLTAFSQTDGKVTATFGNISITKSQVSDFAHNQASNTITAMTSYSMASASGAVATSDSLNTAVGKLEKRIAILEAAIGGMTLVKLTSAQYEALKTKDPNTMYIIND